MCFAHSLGFILYIHMVVEVTMNMAEYTSSWQSAANAIDNFHIIFEPSSNPQCHDSSFAGILSGIVNCVTKSLDH